MAMFVSRWQPVVSTGVCAAIVTSALGLLAAFTLVLYRAVERGEQHRREAAQLWQATWQCKALHQREQRRLCLMQLHTAAPEAATQPGLDAMVVTTTGLPAHR
jgi:Flp pilus assembly protein TadB